VESYQYVWKMGAPRAGCGTAFAPLGPDSYRGGGNR
jgi:hypothetical protein